MNKVNGIISNMVNKVVNLKSSLNLKLYYLINLSKILSSKVRTIAKANEEYLKAIDKGMRELEKKRENPRYGPIIAQAQKRFLEKHKDLIHEIPKSHIKAKYREIIVTRIHELKDVKLTAKTKEIEKLEALFELFIVVFQNNKNMHDVIQNEMLPPMELGAGYQKELNKSKKKNKEDEYTVDGVIEEINELEKKGYDDKKIEEYLKGKKIRHKRNVSMILHYKNRHLWIGRRVGNIIDGAWVPATKHTLAKADDIIASQKGKGLIKLEKEIEEAKPFGAKTIREAERLEKEKILQFPSWTKGRISKREAEEIEELKEEKIYPEFKRLRVA